MSLEKIKKLRKKLSTSSSKEDEKVQKGKDDTPCPTGVLLYLASGRHSPHEVQPWYGVIKEKTSKASYWELDKHQALIFGMYPELEPAVEYFSKQLEEKCAKGRLSDESLIQTEKQTIEKFKLPQSFPVDVDLTPEQEKNVAGRMACLKPKGIARKNPLMDYLAEAQIKL